MNLIMLNLFLAILLTNFDKASSEKDESLSEEKAFSKFKRWVKLSIKNCRKKSSQVGPEDFDLELSSDDELLSDDEKEVMIEVDKVKMDAEKRAAVLGQVESADGSSLEESEIDSEFDED